MVRAMILDRVNIGPFTSELNFRLELFTISDLG